MKKKRVDQKGLMLLRPAPDKCQECAAKHPPEEPHTNGIFYAVQWNLMQNQYREPTWEDAMAHCDDQRKEYYRLKLRFLGKTGSRDLMTKVELKRLVDLETAIYGD